MANHGAGARTGARAECPERQARDTKRPGNVRRFSRRIDAVLDDAVDIFDPQTCAECHGNIHDLQSDPTRNLSVEEQQVVAQMETEITSLEEKAETNLQSGIVGGAVGALVLVIFLFIAVRLGRMR